ncbi:MAG: hypothetical protein KJ906_02905 [Nanoarchaeota archaeon]|nr:hypothetical protein [Nanoarchaeota archaeon]
MYSTSVSSKIVFENNSEPKLTKLDISVDGYNEEKNLKRHKKYYTKEEFENELEYHILDWRIPLWNTMFYDMVDRFKRWKYRRM